MENGNSEMNPLSENLDQLETAIQLACRKAGRARAEVELMAVSKTYPAATILEAAGLGLRLFGESRVQEVAAKAPELEMLRAEPSKAVKIHLIGHLQTNKAKRAVELFDGIDALDSLRLAEKLNEAAADANKRLPVLLEIKVSQEESKAGLLPASPQALELLERLPALENLQMEGLMTIAPLGVGESETRAAFRALRQQRDCWASAFPRLSFEVLSMGMSGDFQWAIEEGATRIRVGTSLFGARSARGTL